MEKREKIRFARRKKEDFASVVKERVEDYFRETGHSPYGNGELYLKIVLLSVFYITTYTAIMSNHFQGLPLILLFGAMGLWKALMGFNWSHDALHGSFSSSPRLNRLLGYIFDLNGTSSHVWILSHNGFHHTYTNIPGVDQDIEKAITLRFSPKDRLYPFHYFQNWYAPLLYCFTGLWWVFVSDYKWFFQEMPKGNVSMKEGGAFVFLKIVNLLMFIILPLMLLSAPWWQVVLGYLSLQFIGSFIIAIVFQLAHLVEGVQFPEPDDQGWMEKSWVEHEMYTTSNFGTHQSIITFLVGGLNFQIEHHLFPYISHVHYPKIAPIVKNTAREFGIPYNEMPSLIKAIQSHFRVLKALGREVTPAFLSIQKPNF